jgi:NADH-quinone oxidoreductase subunit I
MSQIWDGLRSFGTTIKNVFRTPTTVQFPKEKRERSERYRTSFALLHDAEGDEACVGCLQCERICPSQVITVIAEKKESPVTGKRRGYATDFVLDLNACIFCELCVQVCPTDAIVMTRLPETPGYSREDLCLTMDRLYENEKINPATWGTATLLMEMQDPKRGQPKPPPKEKKAPKAAAAEPAPKAAAAEPAPKAAAAEPAPKAAAAEPAPKPEPANKPAAAPKPVPKPEPKPDDDFKEEMTSCETPSSKRSTPPGEEPKP